MAESLWKRLGPAPLEVEGYELERLEQPVTRGFTRVTTVVHLRGGGHEGLGEDVTWYPEHHDREQQAGAVLPLAGSWTLESFSDALDMPDPHRRWAYESAALDLALRQAGTTPCRGRRPRTAPGHVRRLAGARQPADEPGRPALARARPEPPLQARPGDRLDRPADRRRSPTPARS